MISCLFKTEVRLSFFGLALHPKRIGAVGNGMGRLLKKEETIFQPGCDSQMLSLRFHPGKT